MGFLRKSSPAHRPSSDPRDTFAIVIHEEDDGYWAEVPELPGCASQGATMDELIKNIIDAIQGCLEVHLEDEGPHYRHNVMTMNLSVPLPPDLIPA